MQIPGFNVRGYMALLEKKNAIKYDIKKVDAIAKVSLKDCQLKFDGASNNYRPYLSMYGYITDLVGNFGNNVDLISLSNDESEIFIGVYEFSKKELVELVDRGLYSKDFRVPKMFTEEDSVFEFPVESEIYCVKDSDLDNKPLYFVNVLDCKNYEANTEKTDYQLSAYFENVELQEKGLLKLNDVKFYETKVKEDIKEEVVTNLVKASEKRQELEDVITKKSEEVETKVESVLEPNVDISIDINKLYENTNKAVDVLFNNNIPQVETESEELEDDKTTDLDEEKEKEDEEEKVENTYRELNQHNAVNFDDELENNDSDYDGLEV